MPKSVRLVINIDGFNAYRNSPGVTALVEEAAKGVSERFQGSVESFGAAHGIEANPEYPDVTTSITHGTTRVRAYVRASSFRARLAEAKERLLLTALGGAG